MTQIQPDKDKFDLNDLLHPARKFDNPSQVLSDPDLDLNEKRAILASWASDACAVEAAPGLREPAPGARITFDEIMDALRELDRKAVRRPDYGLLLSRVQRVKEVCWPRGNSGGTPEAAQ